MPGEDIKNTLPGYANVREAAARVGYSLRWNGLSVPDAEMVIRISGLLHASANESLGVGDIKPTEALAAEPARASEKLSEMNKARKAERMAENKMYGERVISSLDRYDNAGDVGDTGGIPRSLIIAVPE